MIVAAVIIVTGQGCVIYALLRFIRTFGVYTDALLQAHESNVIVHQYQVKILAESQRLQPCQKREVA